MAIRSSLAGRVTPGDHLRKRRPQIQEKAVARLADLLQDKMQPDDLAIVMAADRCCMQWRGVKDMNSKMTHSITRGSLLKNPDLRREFPSLLRDQRK